MSKYPQHDKLHEVKDESQAIGVFIEEFLTSKGIHLGHYYEFEDTGGKQFTSTGVPPIQQLLAEFYDIDYDELMAEKERMLEAMRERNG